MKQGSFARWFVWFLPLVLLLVAAPAALALDGRTGENVVVAADEIINDDLYITGTEVTILGTVNGDVFAAGQTIRVDGTINGDFFAGGTAITVNGYVADDVRVAGTAIIIGEEANIGSDVIAFGYSAETLAGSVIGNDMFFAGLQLQHAGVVDGNLTADAGGIKLLGTVNGDVEVTVSATDETAGPAPTVFMPGMPAVPTVPMGLTVADEANIVGNLDYTTSDNVAIPASAVIGEISRHLPETTTIVVTPPTRTERFLAWGGEQLQTYIGLLLFGLLVVWLVPTWLRRTTGALGHRPVASFAWGLVVYFGIIIGFAILLVLMIMVASLFGFLALDNLVGSTIVLGLFAIVALAVLFGFGIAYFTKIAVGTWFGSWFLGLFSERWGSSQVASLFVGLLALVLVTSIPYVGGWLSFIIVLMGFGAFWLFGRGQYEHQAHAEEAIQPEAKLGSAPA
ncbi:MAG: hypothetical protein KDE59_05975 [Anaerolineales bacterium]|nr:hypothetical protein [Anaerolineales bacterium]